MTTVGRTRMEVVEADITTLDVDAIVNAANERMLGGGGVDGAIHGAAGPELLKACRTAGPCPTGEARITDGYELPAAHVVHAVGPVWRGGSNDEPVLLASAYRSSLELAVEHRVRSIAFPSISTGVYGYPVDAAATVAVDTCAAFARGRDDAPTRILFCCFSPVAADAHRRALAKL